MKEIATLETVRSAVDALEAQGKSATASAVIAAIGGGSKLRRGIGVSRCHQQLPHGTPTTNKKAAV